MKKFTLCLLLGGVLSVAGLMSPVLAQTPEKVDENPQSAPVQAAKPKDQLRGKQGSLSRPLKVGETKEGAATAAENGATTEPATAPVSATLQPVKRSLSTPAANATKDEIERFCRNIDGQASDSRFELQLRQLNTLRAEVDGRIKVLEDKRKEYEDWLAKRNAFLAQTQDAFVSIISKMRPDAAAAQLTLVDDVAAASIILKLEPRISSAIMNELPPEKAAKLTYVLVSAQKVPPEKTAPSKPVKAAP